MTHHGWAEAREDAARIGVCTMLNGNFRSRWRNFLRPRMTSVGLRREGSTANPIACRLRRKTRENGHRRYRFVENGPAEIPDLVVCSADCEPISRGQLFYIGQPLTEIGTPCPKAKCAVRSKTLSGCRVNGNSAAAISALCRSPWVVSTAASVQTSAAVMDGRLRRPAEALCSHASCCAADARHNSDRAPSPVVHT